MIKLNPGKIVAPILAVFLLQACAVTSDSTTKIADRSTDPVPTVISPPSTTPQRQPVPQRQVQQQPQPKTVLLGKSTNNPLGLVAQDFLHALLQAPGISSVRSQIGTRSMRSGFESALVNGLKGQGFSFVQTSKANSRNVLKTKTIPNPSKKQEVTFTLELNHLAFKRTYEIRPNYVRPVSGLFVKGVSAQAIKLDDRIFVQNFDI